MDETQGKPAIQSKTMGGLAAIALGWALTFILPRLGFDPHDIPNVKKAVFDLWDIGAAALVPAGVIVAAWGRRTAKGPITGVIKAAPVESEDPPH